MYTGHNYVIKLKGQTQKKGILPANHSMYLPLNNLQVSPSAIFITSAPHLSSILKSNIQNSLHTSTSSQCTIASTCTSQKHTPSAAMGQRIQRVKEGETNSLSKRGG